MRTISTMGALAAALIVAAGGTFAQRSLFDPPTAPAPAPAPPPPATQPATGGQPEATAPADPRPRPRPRPRKPRGPVPTRVLAINNAGVTTLTSLEVSAEGKSARLSKPIGPGTKGSLRLPAFRTCQVSIVASFDGQATDASEVDICKEKAIRFTD